MVVEGDGLSVVASTSVNYEKDFPEYGLGAGGVVRGDHGRVTQPSLMVRALPRGAVVPLWPHGLWAPTHAVLPRA